MRVERLKVARREDSRSGLKFNGNAYYSLGLPLQGIGCELRRLLQWTGERLWRDRVPGLVGNGSKNHADDPPKREREAPTGFWLALKVARCVAPPEDRRCILSMRPSRSRYLLLSVCYRCRCAFRRFIFSRWTFLYLGPLAPWYYQSIPGMYSNNKQAVRHL